MDMETDTIDLGDDRIDFGARLPQRFAGLGRDEVAELFRILAHGIGKAARDLDPVTQRERRPGRPGAARAADGGLDIRKRAAPHFFARRRGMGNKNVFAHLQMVTCLLPHQTR